ncbi:MAG: DsbA family protein [Rhodospirillales bacterium]|nr:DsbA family protein [Rhodospirillales bacterium]MBO6788331.1 DsbA family protein [Rhodospirillales bacterium]
MSEPLTLEVFSDYVCPWCYLGDNRIKKLRENFDIDVKLVHFPLHPETPAEGRRLMDLFGTDQAGIDEKNNRMRGLMADEGLPFADRTHTFNSRLAQEVGKWAETQPGGDAIHDLFFEAYFVDKRNIAEPDVILDVVAKAGLDVDAARDVIENRTFKDAVDEDWSKSHAYGVTGVPTFVSEGHGMVGAQPYDALAAFVTEMGAKPKTPVAG